jgi:hypothetical protein
MGRLICTCDTGNSWWIHGLKRRLGEQVEEPKIDL